MEGPARRVGSRGMGGWTAADACATLNLVHLFVSGGTVSADHASRDSDGLCAENVCLGYR